MVKCGVTHFRKSKTRVIGKEDKETYIDGSGPVTVEYWGKERIEAYLQEKYAEKYKFEEIYRSLEAGSKRR